MPYELFIAKRYLQSKQHNGFISVIAFIAIGGVILGVAALIIMLSVTNGFSKEVRSRLIGMNAHVSIHRYYGDPILDAEKLIERVVSHKKIVAAAPVIEGKVVIAGENEMDGLFVWGINQESFPEVSDLPKHLYDSSRQLRLGVVPGAKHSGIVLGRHLASRLRVAIGDQVLLMTVRGMERDDLLRGITPRVHAFLVTDLFESGMYHYDDNFGFISLSKAQEILSLGDGVTNIHLRVANLDEASDIRGNLEEELGYPYRLTDWTQHFPELFEWMELEKWVIFIALSLIIVVAAFNIMSILSMSILIKTPEIGILRAMGSRAAGIRRIFVYQGVVIGAFGTALGCLCGFIVCWLQAHFEIISIPSDIYIISSLPVDMQWVDFGVVSLVSLGICLVASVIPAQRAATLQPVEAIRHLA